MAEARVLSSTVKSLPGHPLSGPEQTQAWSPNLDAAGVWWEPAFALEQVAWVIAQGLGIELDADDREMNKDMAPATSGQGAKGLLCQEAGGWVFEEVFIERGCLSPLGDWVVKWQMEAAGNSISTRGNSLC